MFLCEFFRFHVVHKSERRHRSRLKTEAAVHPLRRSERKFSLSESMLKRMNVKIFMTFKDNQIMSVSLMITEKEILAMGRIYILPIFKSKFDCRKRWMGVKFI